MKVYPLAVDAIMRGEVDVTSVDLRALLVGGGYVFDDAHGFLADVDAGDRIKASPTLEDVSLSAGELFAAPSVVESVPAGDTVRGVILYVHTGDDATARLLSHMDRQGDTTPIDRETNGGDINLSWPANRIFKL